jgi:hypothetical protein
MKKYGLVIGLLVAALVSLSGCLSVQDIRNVQEESTNQEAPKASAPSESSKPSVPSESADSRSELPETKTFGAIQLTRLPVLDGKAELLVPDSFSIMSEEMLSLKYPSERAPSLVYTNEETTVNLAIEHTQNRIGLSGFEYFYGKMEEGTHAQMSSAEWHRSSLETINGREVGVFEFTIQAIDTDIYNLMWFTELDGTMLMMSFNSTVEEETYWKEAAYGILESFEVK